MDVMSTIPELNFSRIHLEMLQPESRGNPNVRVQILPLILPLANDSVEYPAVCVDVRTLLGVRSPVSESKHFMETK